MGRGPGIRAVGAEAIQIDFRWKGVRCRERLRLRPTAANLKYAARLKATIEHEIATGSFDYARHFPESARARLSASGTGLPIRAALLAYIGSLAGSVEPETIREYERDAEIVAQWFRDKTTTTLTRADVRAKLAQQNLSRARLTNLLKPLRGMFAQAVEDYALPNPLQGFKIRRIEPADEKIDPFTPEEVARLGRVQCGELWTFWAWTGPRSGEIIGLRWDDVASECDAVSIRRAVRLGREKATKTKAGTRHLSLLPAARAALIGLTRRAGTDPVFINPRTGADWHEAKALNREFKRACKASGVRFRYAYQLRHTFATWALSSGENPLWVAKMMGHTDVAVLHKHYAKWMPALNPTAGAKMATAAEVVKKSPGPKARRGQRAA